MHEPQGEPVNKWGSQPKFYKELLQFIVSESTGVGCKPVLTQCKGHTRLRLLSETTNCQYFGEEKFQDPSINSLCQKELHTLALGNKSSPKLWGP